MFMKGLIGTSPSQRYIHVSIERMLKMAQLCSRVKRFFLVKVTYDPEVEADMGPVVISPITPPMEQVDSCFFKL